MGFRGQRGFLRQVTFFSVYHYVVKPSSYAAFTAECDQLIKIGKSNEARSRLEKLKAGQIPKDHLAEAASLCARSGAADVGLRLLSRLVRPPKGVPSEASEAERAEYAHCLLKLGFSDEALATLASVKRTAYPRAYLYEAGTSLSRWDYAAAIPRFESYLSSKGLSPYDRLVGETNLASALVYERKMKQASYLLHEVIYETGNRKLTLLHANALELAAYMCLLRGRFSETRKFLDEASTSLAGSKNVDEFFTRKWLAILEYLEGRRAPSVLEGIRNEARSRRHFETIRDCDRFQAVATKDEKLFKWLYFGTPYPSFRKRLLRDFGEEPTIPAGFSWKPTGAPGKITLDVLAGKVKGKAGALHAWGSLHRLLLLLTSDFYRPFRMASVFEKLFPAEHFNPDSSFARVHQAIQLLRKWLEENGVPLTVESRHGSCRIVAAEDCTLVVPGEAVPANLDEERLAKLRRAWPEKAFSVEEARGLLQTSYRTAHRAIRAAVGEGKLQRIGKTAFARYRFPPP